NFLYIIGHANFDGRGAIEPGLLLSDGDTLIERGGIVSADFAADAVFQRRDDLAAGSIVFGVCGEDQREIKWKANGVAFDLHISFLHDVEEANLNFAGEIGKLIDGEDAPVGSREQAVVNR